MSEPKMPQPGDNGQQEKESKKLFYLKQTRSAVMELSQKLYDLAVRAGMDEHSESSNESKQVGSIEDKIMAIRDQIEAIKTNIITDLHEEFKKSDKLK